MESSENCRLTPRRQLLLLASIVLLATDCRAEDLHQQQQKTTNQSSPVSSPVADFLLDFLEWKQTTSTVLYFSSSTGEGNSSLGSYNWGSICVYTGDVTPQLCGGGHALTVLGRALFDYTRENHSVARLYWGKSLCG